MYKVYMKKVGGSVCSSVQFIYSYKVPTQNTQKTYLPEVPTQQHQSLNTTTILLGTSSTTLYYTTSLPFRLFFFWKGETEQNETEQQWAAHPLRLLVMRIAG